MSKMINLPRKGFISIGSSSQPPGLIDESGTPDQYIYYLIIPGERQV